MSYEDRVMTRLVNVRQHLELLQHRLMSEQIDKLTLMGELESIKTQVSRTLLEPVDEEQNRPARLSLISTSQSQDEEST